MTSSIKPSQRGHAIESELRMWWTLSSQVCMLLRSERTDAHDDMLAELHDEMDVLRLYTDWPAMKIATTKQLNRNAQCRPDRLVAVA